MEKHIVRVIDTGFLNHDVKRFRLERPENYDFIPGQATEIAINKKEWKDETRPFTFTNLPDEDFLEFTIKIYPSHEGVTNELQNIKRGDELILHEVFGAIQFKGNGMFIAGGAGVTPFIAILRKLKSENKINGNKLVFGNKKAKDIFLEDEFNKILGKNFKNILSKEDTEQHDYGHITKKYIEKNIDDNNQFYYVCGPPAMMEMVLKNLSKIGIKEEKIIKEDF